VMCPVNTVFLSLAALITVAASRDVDSLLSAWEHGCQALSSYDLYISVERKGLRDPETLQPFDEPRISRGTSHQIFREGKRRIEDEVREPGQQVVRVLVWDGEVAKHYNSAAKQLGLEADINATTPPGLDYEALFRTLGDLSWIEIVRARPETRVEGQEGDQFILYTPPTPQGGYNMSPFGYRIWLDSGKNFLPSRIQDLLESSGEEFVYTDAEQTLEEVQPGVWAPVRSVFTHYPSPSTHPPAAALQKIGESAITVDMSLTRFNPEIPDSAFTLDVPVGTTVFDEITGTKYIYGQAHDRASHLSELVLQGKASVEKLKELGAGPVEQEPPRPVSRTLVVLNLVGLLLVLAAIAAYRVRARKRRVETP
jgi:hypothetical protein